MKNKTEYQYMQTDDTVDVGKGPLPEESKEISAWKENWIKKINEAIKKDKQN